MSRSQLRSVPRLVLALVTGAALSWMVSSCGSGGSGTLSQKAQEAVSNASTRLEASTGTGPAKTGTTPTPPPKTTTVEKTTTVTVPARTTTVVAPTTSVTNQTTTVHLTPTSTTGSESSGGIPGWGWLLIALGVVGIGVGMFLAGRDRRDRRTDRVGRVDDQVGGPPDETSG